MVVTRLMDSSMPIFIDGQSALIRYWVKFSGNPSITISDLDLEVKPEAVVKIRLRITPYGSNGLKDAKLNLYWSSKGADFLNYSSINLRSEDSFVDYTLRPVWKNKIANLKIEFADLPELSKRPLLIDVDYIKIVDDKRALGELDHPEDSVVNLKNVSHMVLKVWWDNDAVMGKVKVLDTPSGKILRSLVESGVKLGISSRGLGSVKEKAGLTYVEDDFQLICFDFVSEPSTTGAFMNLSESKKAPNIFNKSDKINRLLNDIIGV